MCDVHFLFLTILCIAMWNVSNITDCWVGADIKVHTIFNTQLHACMCPRVICICDLNTSWRHRKDVVCVPLCQLVHLLWIRLIGRLVQNRLKHSQLWSFYVCIFSFLGPCICCVHTVEWFLLTMISYHT